MTLIHVLVSQGKIQLENTAILYSASVSVKISKSEQHFLKVT